MVIDAVGVGIGVAPCNDEYYLLVDSSMCLDNY